MDLATRVFDQPGDVEKAFGVARRRGDVFPTQVPYRTVAHELAGGGGALMAARWERRERAKRRRCQCGELVRAGRSVSVLGGVHRHARRTGAAPSAGCSAARSNGSGGDDPPSTIVLAHPEHRCYKATKPRSAVDPGIPGPPSRTVPLVDAARARGGVHEVGRRRTDPGQRQRPARARAGRARGVGPLVALMIGAVVATLAVSGGPLVAIPATVLVLVAIAAAARRREVPALLRAMTGRA